MSLPKALCAVAEVYGPIDTKAATRAETSPGDNRT